MDYSRQRGGPSSGGNTTEVSPKFSITQEEVAELVGIVREHWCGDGPRSPGSYKDACEVFGEIRAILRSRPTPSAGTAYLSKTGTRDTLRYVMRSIIDGPIDGDKLDYLRRDALHSGVFFANSIDLDRFFESLRACVRTDGTAKTLVPAIGVSEKGVAPIETILTARYHMYSIVYWHRTARCLTAILQRVISDICLMLGETARIDVFLAQLVEKFRRLDDRQALYWLKGEVERVGLSAIPAGTQTDAHGGLTERVTLTGLIDALLGLRKNFFGTGFELGYVGPVNPDSSKEITPREQLHDDMCGIIYAADKDGGGSGSGRHDNRARLREFRLELEKAFSLEISQKTHGDFVLDTILIDVPEPGKDQVKGVFVDRHTKRSWIGQEVDIHVVFDDLSSIRQSPHPSGKSLHDGLGRLEFL